MAADNLCATVHVSVNNTFFAMIDLSSASLPCWHAYMSGVAPSASGFIFSAAISLEEVVRAGAALGAAAGAARGLSCGGDGNSLTAVDISWHRPPATKEEV